MSTNAIRVTLSNEEAQPAGSTSPTGNSILYLDTDNTITLTITPSDQPIHLTNGAYFQLDFTPFTDSDVVEHITSNFPQGEDGWTAHPDGEFLYLAYEGGNITAPVLTFTLHGIHVTQPQAAANGKPLTATADGFDTDSVHSPHRHGA